MTPAPPLLGCPNPLGLPPAPPAAKRQSCANFTDWDLLGLAYGRIGLNPDGSAKPNSIFELHAKLHAGVCSGPVDIHASGGPFLIWHRAFLFFHERALNQALLQDGTIKQDTLRLPYWQWDSVNADFIPLPAQCTTPGNVLYANRPYNPVSAAEANGDALQSMLGLQSFIFAQNSIETVHSDIHLAFIPANMSVIAKAAYDPLFYAHHSEVDRLFESWQLMHKNLWPTPAGTARFYDAKGNPGCYRLADFMDLSKLGYDYQDYPAMAIEPDLAVPSGAELKIVLPVGKMQDPMPNHWAFVADQEPQQGHPLAKESLIGYGFPPSGMMRMNGMAHMNGAASGGVSLAFLLHRDHPKRVWAATITNQGEVLRVDEVKHFAIEKNVPDPS
jgi:hypothetical protein